VIILLSYCSYRHRKDARKCAKIQQVCSECKNTIGIGESYFRISGTDDLYRFSTVKICLDCYYSTKSCEDWCNNIDYETTIAEGFEVHD
jgi:hypothetical protein